MASDVEKANSVFVSVAPTSSSTETTVLSPPSDASTSKSSEVTTVTSSNSFTNSIASSSTTTTNNTATTTTKSGLRMKEGEADEDDDHNNMSNERKGWLMKRSRLSHKWKRKWFLLKNADLFYGNDPQSTSKRISLVNAEISESHMDKKSYAFRIKPRNHRRAFYIHAENELEQNNWMQAICFAKAAGRLGDNSQACVLQ
ncbi:uncharacterized protein LOC106880322 isoform X2 [Octopus bimaculoides]|nr:uncharacterized protein LOC106880322 isoform X2 [Octopus bimaculoides]|eukprot:XP_014785685.1 PREDICTED: pleckstrin homology domain-containing protein 1-like [Octopus bimaculoides]